MREIEFRAWVKADNAMIGHREVIERAHLQFDDRLGQDSDIVMQYIDRKDRNGKKIFEHDILKSNRDKDDIGAGVVVYLYGCAGIQVIDMLKMKGTWVNEWIPCSSILYLDQSFEVVGNVYENPGLIKDFEALQKFHKFKI